MGVIASRKPAHRGLPARYRVGMAAPRESYAVTRSTKTSVVVETSQVSRDPNRPDKIEIRFDRRQDRPVSVTVSSGAGLRPSDMRRLPWHSWFWFADVARREMTADADGSIALTDAAVAFADADSLQPAQRRPGRRGHPDEHYQRIARRYEELVATGVRSPTAAIAKESVVSRDTAAGWVAGARKRGYLPPARPGRAG